MTWNRLRELTNQASRNLGAKKCWIKPEELLQLCEIAIDACDRDKTKLTVRQ